MNETVNAYNKVGDWWCSPSWWRKGPQGVLWDEAQNENAVPETPSIGLWKFLRSYVEEGHVGLNNIGSMYGYAPCYVGVDLLLLATWYKCGRSHMRPTTSIWKQG